MITTPFAEAHPAPWHIQGAEIVDANGVHVNGFDDDDPGEAEYHRGVVEAVNAQVAQAADIERLKRALVDAINATDGRAAMECSVEFLCTGGSREVVAHINKLLDGKIYLRAEVERLTEELGKSKATLSAYQELDKSHIRTCESIMARSVTRAETAEASLAAAWAERDAGKAQWRRVRNVLRNQTKLLGSFLRGNSSNAEEQYKGLSDFQIGASPAIYAALSLDAQPQFSSAPSTEPTQARALSEWHEDYGNAVWWTLEDGQWLGEPAYIGSPLDLGRTILITIDGKEMTCDVGGWPGYHTHWTPHPEQPPLPISLDAQGDKE